MRNGAAVRLQEAFIVYSAAEILHGLLGSELQFSGGGPSQDLLEAVICHRS